MKSNPFNICPTCVHENTCVLTTQKSQVWSCSEYDEETVTIATKLKPKSIMKKEPKPEMAIS
ncbi:hypothetical protein GCM10007384_05350 [Aquimarina muelleri]|uniref:Uncharacterized protein n=1 Tax=Aquimarina muelleri TaxID=279356 RepID=A0A918JT20_9FLAO|nr:hypothetical protein GCM10007384_05350 [Aquimarina muelleri]